MSKIGLFFGSFNPIHHGHLIIGQHLVNQNIVDRVEYIVSPQNPLKEKSELLDEHLRLEMLSIALQAVEGLTASDVEFDLPKPSYTIQTLRKLRSLYPKDELFLIIGSDNLGSFASWKDSKEILEYVELLVFERPGYEIPEASTEFAFSKIKDTPLLNLSSSQLRAFIREGRSIRFYTPVDVVRFIEKKGLYKSC